MSDLESAVRADLEAWKLTDSALGAAAIDLARRLNSDELRPAAAALLHGQLGARLADLRKLAPEAETSDEIDDLKARLTLLPPVGESG